MTTFEELAIVLAGLHLKSDDLGFQKRLNFILHVLMMLVWLSSLVPGIKMLMNRDFRKRVWASVIINLSGIVTAISVFIVVKEDVTLEISELVAACAVRYLHQIYVIPAPATLPITTAIALPSGYSSSNEMRDSIMEAIGSALRLACPEAALNVSHVPFLKFGSHIYGTTIYTLNSHQNTALTSETTSAADTSETTSPAPPSTGFIYKIISVVAGRE